MELLKAIEFAAGHLPEGWLVELNVEQGSAWVNLCDSDGSPVRTFEPSPDITLAEQVMEAVRFANGEMEE